MADLKTALDKKKKSFDSVIPRPIRNYMEKVTKDLKTSGYEEKPLKVGDVMPDGNFINYLNEPVLLTERIENRATIISFYRGAWCPYCNLELRAYDDLLKEKKNADVLMIAISPEKPDVTLADINIEKLNFDVYSDVDNVFANKLGLGFRMPKMLKFLYRFMGININKSQENKAGELPLPATYIIDKNKKIVNVWVDVDYRKRAEPSEVLMAYKNI